MELNGETFAILAVFFGTLIWLLWDVSDEADGDYDDFWEEIEPEDEEIEDDADRPQSGEK